MNNLNKFLIGALVVQVILAAIIYRPKEEAKAPGGLLLTDFDPSAVIQLKITDDKDEEITVTKSPEGDWILPEMDAFLVNSGFVSGLLQKIAGAQTNRLITQSETSHRRLKVSPDEFLRQVEITSSGGDKHTVYLGTTGGGNATHARLDDDKNVYLVGNLSIQDATTQVSSWINTTYVGLNGDDVLSMKLENGNGAYEFTKNGDQWTLVGLADGETFNDNAFQSMFNQAIAVRMVRPLGKEDSPDYGLDAPQATLTITVRVLVPTPEPTAEASDQATAEATDQATEAAPAETPTPSPTPEPQYTEKTYVIKFGAKIDDNNVAKSDDSEYFVYVTEGNARTFIDKSRDSFVISPTPTPTPTLEPTQEATAAPTEAATQEPTEAATTVPTEAATQEAAPEATEAVTQEAGN